MRIPPYLMSLTKANTLASKPLNPLIIKNKPFTNSKPLSGLTQQRRISQMINNNKNSSRRCHCHLLSPFPPHGHGAVAVPPSKLKTLQTQPPKITLLHFHHQPLLTPSISFIATQTTSVWQIKIQDFRSLIWQIFFQLTLQRPTPQFQTWTSHSIPWNSIRASHSILQGQDISPSSCHLLVS